MGAEGGLTLQLRLGLEARTTKDIDLLFLAAGRDAQALLTEADALDLGDWFRFEIAPQGALLGDSYRFRVRSLPDNRLFEQFHLDVGVGDPLFGPPEMIMLPDVLGFADIPPVPFVVIPSVSILRKRCMPTPCHVKAAPAAALKIWWTFCCWSARTCQIT